MDQAGGSEARESRSGMGQRVRIPFRASASVGPASGRHVTALNRSGSAASSDRAPKALPDLASRRQGGRAPTGSAAATAPRGWTFEQRLWWLLWASCPGLGWVRLGALQQACGDLATAWSMPAEILCRLPGWHAGLRPRLEAFRSRWGPDPLRRFAAAGPSARRVLLPGDRRWPAALGGLERPPLALWWCGRGSLWSLLAGRQAVAVVGTRRPSPHGIAMARSIGSALAQGGWPVVSGLAEGIDGAVHAGCLAAGGSPVAVLGTPLDRVYPRHHAGLQASVERQGLLVSEQPPGAAVHRSHFAGRNRLLVAFAAAVVVVECPAESGALHSASQAWQQGLPLWVVPADAGRASALGSNRLLARGAAPLLTPEDLLTSLGAGPLRRSEPPPSHAAAGGLGRAQRGLLQALGSGASLDELCERTGRSAAELALELLELECAGRLLPLPGLRWLPGPLPSGGC